MADDVTRQINVVATSKGFDQLLKTLNLTETQLKQLLQDGKINEQQWEQMSRTVGKTAAQFQKVSGAQNQATAATKNNTQANQQNAKATRDSATSARNYADVLRTAINADIRGAKALRDRADAAWEVQRAEKGSRGYRNASTTVDSAISQGEEVRARELAQLKAQILQRDKESTAEARRYQSVIAKTVADQDKLAQATREKAEAEERASKALRASQGAGRADRDASVRAYDQEVQAGIRARLEREALAGATTKADVATTQMAGNLPRLRYALYDVSTTLAFTGAAMTGLATATAAVSIQMDRTFADVVRTTGTFMDQTGQSTADLRSEFNELFSTLPKSWADITDIGTLAGQLGIATENVAEFTSLVAKFATVTDVTVEASATAFGRLSQLLSVPAEQYENLGSSILAVGVSSVATESQIISISSQIASMGDFAGLSADEVIGFSSALASLGVQPELSRGTITRLFTNIATAVDTGGEKLDAFASLADSSASEFADAWRNDASGAIMQLLQGLESIDAAGGSAITSLREVGITSVRDVPTLLKLAQNYQFVGEQLQIATDGYAEGTALQEQYGVVAETTAEKLTLLTNNIQLFISELGETDGVLATIIDGVTSFVRGLTAIADNDVAQLIGGITLAVTALGGILLIAAGGAARFAASGLAIRTALQDMARDALVAGSGLRGFSTEADIASAKTYQLAGGLKAVRVALISTGVGAALAIAGSALAYFWGEADKANQRMKDLQGTFEGTLATDTQAWKDGATNVKEFEVEVTNSNYASEIAVARAGELAESLTGVESSASNATEEVKNYTGALGEATQAAVDAALNEWILGDGTGEEQLKRVQDLQRGLDLLGVSFEDFSGAVVANDQEFLAGLNAEAFTTLEQKAADANVEVYNLDTATYDALQTVQSFATEATNEADALRDAQDAAAAAALATGITGVANEAAAEAAAEASGEFEEYAGSVEGVTEAIFGMINAQSGLNSSLYELGQSVYENGSNFDAFSASGRANLEALQGVFSATADYAAANGVTFEDAMAVVGRAMVQSGVISVQQLEALSGASINFGNDLLTVAEATSRAVAQLQGQMAALEAGNTALDRGQTAEALRYTGQALKVIEEGGAGATAAMKSMGIEFNRIEGSGSNVDALLDQIADGWRDSGDEASKSGGKQSKAAKDAAKEVRTLSDYVSDLESVIADAFDFRFGFQEAKDDGADAFQAITDRIDDAKTSVRDLNQSIRETRATIGSLKADRSLLNYQLGIAVDYKDELRATAIRAELAENSVDLKDAENDLTDAQQSLKDQQDILTLSLTSNTEAGRENRDLVLGLIQAYQSQITEYANTGASQQEVKRYTEDLNRKFQDQLRQLGYNTDEVKDYSKAFQDTKTVLDKMPKNLTLKANTDPAQRAMEEYKAKIKDVDSSIDDVRENIKRGGLNLKVGSSFDDAGAKKAARLAEKQADIAYITARIAERLRAGGSSYEIGAMRSQINNLERQIANRDYYDGGYTGRGGKYEPAGIVHKGEYVVPKNQVNQATGLPYADAFNRLSRGVPSPAGYANGGYASAPSYPGTVSLSAMSIQQIARAVQPYVVMNGQVVGEITSNQYARGTRVGSN